MTLFILAKDEKQSKQPSIGDLLNKAKQKTEQLLKKKKKQQLSKNKIQNKKLVKDIYRVSLLYNKGGEIRMFAYFCQKQRP